MAKHPLDDLDVGASDGCHARRGAEEPSVPARDTQDGSDCTAGPRTRRRGSFPSGASDLEDNADSTARAERRASITYNCAAYSPNSFRQASNGGRLRATGLNRRPPQTGPNAGQLDEVASIALLVPVVIVLSRSR